MKVSIAAVTALGRSNRRNEAIVRLRITTTTPATRDAAIRSRALTMHRSRALIPLRVPTRRQIAVTQRQAAAVTVVADIAVAEGLTTAVVADTAVVARVEAVPLRAIAPAAVVRAAAVVLRTAITNLRILSGRLS